MTNCEFPGAGPSGVRMSFQSGFNFFNEGLLEPDLHKVVVEQVADRCLFHHTLCLGDHTRANHLADTVFCHLLLKHPIVKLAEPHTKERNPFYWPLSLPSVKDGCHSLERERRKGMERGGLGEGGACWREGVSGEE